MKVPARLAAWLAVILGLAAAMPAEAACSRDQVAGVQRTLRDAGYKPGPIDGQLGPKTRSAIKRWQKAGDLEPHGRLACEDRRAAKPPAPEAERQARAAAYRRQLYRNDPTGFKPAKPQLELLRHDGGLYHGAVADGRPNGQGRIHWPDGRKYAGGWRNGRFHGRGALVYPDGRAYMGAFKNGKFNGEGLLKHPDGGVYAGAFQAGAFNGQGRYRFPDDSVYRGAFRNGRPNGEGRLRTARKLWRGQWSNGCLVSGDPPVAVLVSPSRCAR